MTNQAKRRHREFVERERRSDLAADGDDVPHPASQARAGEERSAAPDPGADGRRRSEAGGSRRRGPGSPRYARCRRRDCLDAPLLLGALHSDWQLEVVHRPFDRAPQG